jgi:hypothetical protein
MAVNVVMSVQSLYLIEVLRFEAASEGQAPRAVAITPLISYCVTLIF